MNQNLLKKIRYAYLESDGSYYLPTHLKDSLNVISNFFKQQINNKLCLVFPSKECAAQWLSIPSVLFLIESDFEHFKNEITENYKQYNLGEKLKLNGTAIVEWAGIRKNGVAFKTKAGNNSSGAIITIEFSQSIKLQRAQATRQLSTLTRVKDALPGNIITPTDKLLGINTYGNKEFIKNKFCLVTKYKLFEKSVNDVKMNGSSLTDYSLIFPPGKIDENGDIENNSPLLIANNLSNLALYSVANSITKIMIDGFAAILERGTDFSDIDVKNIPTILITDLTEIESFDLIGNYGFEFFNFTKENLNFEEQPGNSPFQAFDKKLKKYSKFNVVKEICEDNDLEIIAQKIHSIEKDDSNQDLNKIKINLIQLTNVISRICHVPTEKEMAILLEKINAVDLLFQRNKIWLGDSRGPIDESISHLKIVIEKFASAPSEKCARLQNLMSKESYNYIICPTEDEAQALRNTLPADLRTKIISIADVNDELLTDKDVKAIITGWAKSRNINKILTSFLFSQLTILFYQFESKYYNSLQRRNRKNSENIKSTITKQGIRTSIDSEKSNCFDCLYPDHAARVSTSEKFFDIVEFELKLDNIQYSKYKANGNSNESVKAKKISFENDFFIYSSESHRFLVVNELVRSLRGEKGNIHRRRIEAIVSGDAIAQINTDRDILADLVEKNTKAEDFASVKKWTDLWKNLLKEYFFSIGNNFIKLVDDLRCHDCKKHEVTIRTWLQDENRIGPEDDSDLISIALMTNSRLLYDIILQVRQAIRKMTGWRMKASDFIMDKIKAQIHQYADSSIINRRISIEGLGTVIVLKVAEISNVWENIDVRYVNRLLQKEIM
jgi:hypothetical protein